MATCSMSATAPMPAESAEVSLWNSSWAEALLADVQSSQETEEQVLAQVEKARTDTSDASDSEPSQSDESVLESRWWVSRLRKSMEALGLHDSFAAAVQRSGRALRVLSCCTGCSAESEVLKATFFSAFLHCLCWLVGSAFAYFSAVPFFQEY